MNIQDPQLDAVLRRIFHYFNHFMVLLWRLGLGVWGNRPDMMGRIMVLVHTGRKSGKRYRTPVNYAIVNREVYCTAGFGANADWYRNIINQPQVEIWLPDSWYAGVAEEMTDSSLRMPILREVLISSGPAARALGVDPASAADDVLERLTSSYRLIHIRKTEARTGPGGPNDLTWVWPLTTLFFATALFIRLRKK
jgi:deazaflavin-dependent oxidoreductase (nitroreductase family)